MSQSPITCHSGPDEKLVSHGERINALSASGKYCIGCLALTAVAVIGGCLYLNGKIGDVQLKQAEELTKVKTEYSIRIDALEKAVAELKASCEQARRDYNSARSSMSQYRRKQREND